MRIAEARIAASVIAGRFIPRDLALATRPALCYYVNMSATPTSPLSLIWPLPFWPDESAPPDALWPTEQQPWSDELVQAVLRRYAPAGSVVLDPFAVQASLPAAAAAARCRLIINNASAAALQGVLASAAPPASALLDHVFSRIADAPRRGRTLAHHLAALYETICPECAQNISAEQFVWDRTSGEPVEKRYHCPHCGSQGSAPADIADINLVTGLEVRGAAYWGLLSRLVKPGDALTAAARSLQDHYLPRALLVTSELITAAEQRLHSSDELRAARALLLHVLVRGLTGEPTPGGPGSIRLRLPRRFTEENLWLAFERAYRTLRARPAATVLAATEWPRLRASEGEGRVWPLALPLSELAERLGPGSVDSIITEPPPFDATWYTLNYLWSGWLYGREAAAPQRAALSNDHWSWDWYTRAMGAALRTLLPLLRPEGRLLLAFSDHSPRRVVALLAAAAAAGWQLSAQATQVSYEPSPPDRITWRLELTRAAAAITPTARPDLPQRLYQQAQQTARHLLAERGEPTPAALVQTACAVGWSESGLLAELPHHEEAARHPASLLLEQFNLALSPDLPPSGMSCYAPGTDAPTLWQEDSPGTVAPLADRLERFIATHLETGPVTWAALLNAVYAAFPGWQTPDVALIRACLSSYAEASGDRWQLRAEDTATQRRADVAALLEQLTTLGQRLGFTVATAAELAATAEAALVWQHDQRTAFVFAVVTQAVVQPWLPVPGETLTGGVRCVALPGGRAGLLDFKLRRCPPWRGQLAVCGWEFIKFRHLRALAAQPDLTPAALRARLSLDPIMTLPGRQLELFET